MVEGEGEGGGGEGGVLLLFFNEHFLIMSLEATPSTLTVDFQRNEKRRKRKTRQTTTKIGRRGKR